MPAELPCKEAAIVAALLPCLSSVVVELQRLEAAVEQRKEEAAAAELLREKEESGVKKKRRQLIFNQPTLLDLWSTGQGKPSYLLQPG